MKIGALQFPEPLLTALRNGNLIVFAGAGVSMGEPANLPSFTCLARQIAADTGEVLQDKEPEDRFLGRLQHRQVDVHARAVRALSHDGLAPTDLHRDLLRLYPTAEQVRIVTTNFDLLFERAAETVFGQVPEVFRAPSLPLGRCFNGIIYVHGAVTRSAEMVLTDADFGRAYLTEGWARCFLGELFRYSTVLFVGYSHNDVIVSYLARALPESEAGRRFALTNEGDDPQRWQVLGIEPIAYPKRSEHDHSAIYDGVRRLADWVRRGILDWQRKLTDLATKPPPVDEGEADNIEHALKQVETTRFFASAARLPEWIDWLDSRKHLDALFREGNLNDRDEVLARWLAEHFAARYPDELFLLIARHGMHLHPDFWRALGREIGKHESLDDQTLSRWISVLLATASAKADEHMLLELGKRCVKQGIIPSVLHVFDAMSGSRLLLKGDTKGRIEVDLPLAAGHYYLNKLWERGLKPHLTQVAETLLAQIARRLEQQHFTLRAWQRANREGDSTTWGRSAIEPHEQDEYPEAIDVLIDAARDCLEWLAAHQAGVAANWGERLVVSEAPLLRRLAIHTISVRPDLAPDGKLDWLLTHSGLHDHAAHHEIYRAVALAYPAASPERREAIIESVLAYRWPNEEDIDKDKRTAFHHFNWLHWLHTAVPTCDLTKQALKDVWASYQEFRPSEHPDFTRWVSRWAGPRSPWTVEELLAKPPDEWLPDLLSFRPTEFLGPDRDGLVQIVAEAAKSSFQWGLKLADALAGVGKWEADLWSELIHAWLEMELDEAGQREVLGWLGKAELYSEHARGIADALYALVKHGGKPYTWDMLPRANGIAAALWSCLDRTETFEEHDGWLQLAINHPAGVLAEFWLGSLSIWRGHQEPVPKTLTDEYRQALADMVRDQSLLGRLARSVLAGQFAFLLAADEAWAREHLLPLFDVDNGIADFQSAWDGFLTWGRLNPTVAEVLEDTFLKAVTRLNSDLPRRCRDRFVEYYTAMLGDFAADPLDKWIPALFQHGDIEARWDFASDVEHHLRNMDDARQRDWWQRWLKLYWENRLQGVPATLEAGEIERMLQWLPHLTAVFPEAVALAIRMPPASLQDSGVIYELREGELPRRYPDAVAQLLIHLGKSGSSGYIWHGAQEVIDAVNRAGVNPGLRQELAAPRGERSSAAKALALMVAAMFPGPPIPSPGLFGWPAA
jgi:hypothetical protein